MKSFRSRYSFSEKKQYATKLRNNPTEAELLLYRKMKKDLPRFDIRSQYVLKGWIVDFFFPQKRLVIEVDGKIHDLPSQRKKDQKKDYVLRRRGYSVLRIRNEEIFSSLKRVIQKIQTRIFQIEQRQLARLASAIKPKSPRNRAS